MPKKEAVIMIADDDQNDRFLAKEAFLIKHLENQLYCTEHGEDLNYGFQLVILPKPE